MKTDLFQSCGHCSVFQICWHIECSTFTASSFRIWNSSAGIPPPPLALFVVMLPKAHLTCIPGCLALGEWSHHRDYLGHEDIFCIVLLCIPATSLLYLLLLLDLYHFCLYYAHLCTKYSLGISNFLGEIGSLSHSVFFLYFFALNAEEGFLISPFYSLELCFRCFYLSFSPFLLFFPFPFSFPFLLCFSLPFFSLPYL